MSKEGLANMWCVTEKYEFFQDHNYQCKMRIISKKTKGMFCNLFVEHCTLWLVGALVRRKVVSSLHSDTGGRRVMRASLVFWRLGASGMGANAVHKKSTFFGALKTSARLSAATKGRDTPNVDLRDDLHAQLSRFSSGALAQKMSFFEMRSSGVICISSSISSRFCGVRGRRSRRFHPRPPKDTSSS